MSFDEHVGLGAIIEIILIVAGLIGGWWTMKLSLKATIEKLAELRKRFDDDSSKNALQHEENQKRMASMDLQIARDCVKIDDFRRLEDRFSTRFDKIEHAVNNAGMKTAGIVEDALRKVLGSRGARE